MITVTKQENGVLFTFTNSDKYLYGSGTIEVPFNSLSIIQDESDNITLRKSASNDIFLSARYDTDFGYASKEAAVEALKEILYDEAGISEEEVQEMIDAATSGIPSSEVVEQLRRDVNTVSGEVDTKQDILTAGENITISGNVISADAGNNIIELTQAEYDALETKDPEVLYIITDAQEINMNDYYTKSEVDASINTKADSSALTAVNNALTAHTANTTVHVTQAEKNTWNGKVDEGYVTDYAYSKNQIDGFLENATTLLQTISGEVDTKVDTTTYESGQYATAQALNALQENKLDASAYTPTDLSEYWTSAQTQSAIDAAGGYLIDLDTIMQRGLTDAEWDGTIAAVNAHRPVYIKFYNDHFILESYSLTDNNNKMYLSASDGIAASRFTIIKNGSNDYSLDRAIRGFVTSAEKDAWNAKADASAITSIESAVTNVQSAVTAVSNDLNTLSGAVIDNEYTVSQAINELKSTKLDASAYTPTDLSEYWTSAQTQSAIDGVKAYFIDLDTIMTRGGLTDAEWDGTIDAIANNRLVYIKTEGYWCTLQSYYLNGNKMKLLAASDNFASIYTVTKLGSNQYSLSNVNKEYVSQAEKDAWNTKVDASALTTVNNALTAHTADTTVHVTQAEKETWNRKQNGLTAGRGLFINADNTISASTAVLGQGGTVGVMQIIKLTQAAYDALSTKDAQTLYIVVD